jgi:hypothetical protein
VRGLPWETGKSHMLEARFDKVLFQESPLCSTQRGSARASTHERAGVFES